MVLSESSLKSTSLHDERLNLAWRLNASPSRSWSKPIMPVGKTLFMTWIIQFMNGNKSLCLISLNLVSNKSHILQFIFGPAATKLAEHPSVMQTSVYYHPLSFAETDQIYTTLLHVQKNGIKHCVLIKTLLSFSGTSPQMNQYRYTVSFLEEVQAHQRQHTTPFVLIW